MELMDKSALVAEIERILSIYTKRYNELAKYEVWITAKEIEYRIQGLKEALSILNTLEAKEVDLKKEIKDYLHKQPIVARSHGTDFRLVPSPEEIARYFYELGLQSQKI